MNYQLEGVWPSPSDEVQRDVFNFWSAEAAIPDLQTAQKRTCQLLVVARDPVGKVAGVSTAVRMHVDQLGFECFYYRTFIGRAHRLRGLGSAELVTNTLWESYRLLNERFLHGNDPDVLGLYAEIENPSIMRFYNKAIWQDDGMNFVFIGRAQNGNHLRVWYFEGARIT